MAKGEEKEKQEPKVPFSERFSEWLHHKPTGPDDEDTYCGTRNGSKWRSLLLFYFCFYGTLIIFWTICFAAMMSHVPDRVGGSGPTVNSIVSFGFVQVSSSSGDYSDIAGDDGSFTFSGTPGTEAFGTIRNSLSQGDYNNLRTAITNDAGVSGNQFLYNNCTNGVGGCTAASNYGNFGPVYLVTYRNRKWNRPRDGANCNMVCTYSATLDDGSTSEGTIANDHFWQLDFESGQWINGNAKFDCRGFQNQPSYRIWTAVSTQGYTRPAQTYTLVCQVNNIEEDDTGIAGVTYVA